MKTQQKNRQISSLSLRKRLKVIFITIALIPALAISIWAISVEYQNGRQQAISRLQFVLTSINMELISWLDGLQAELSVPLSEEFGFERANIVLKLGDKADFYDFYTKALRNRLFLYLSQSKQIQEIFLINSQGQIVLSTDENNEGRNFLDALPHPLPVCIFRDNAVFILNMVYNQENQIMGAIAGRVDIDEVNKILRNSSDLGETGKAFILDEQLTPLAASFELPLGGSSWKSQIDEFINPGLIYIENKQLVNQAVYPDHNNNLVLGIYQWIPETQIAVVVEQNIDEAFKTLFLTLAVSLLIELCAFVLALILSRLTTREIAHPIENLSNAAKRIAQGNLNERVPVEKKDEIGSLAEAFNSMTAQLQELISNLELRVDERTRDLSQRALQLETSARVSQQVISILDIYELLNKIVELIQKSFGYYQTSIYLLDHASGQLVYQTGTGQSTHTRINTIDQNMVQSNEPVLIHNGTRDSGVLNGEPQYGFSSELIIPLRVAENIIGSLDIQSKKEESFSPEDILLLQSLGDQIAIAIENARLYQQNRELAVLEERNRLARDMHDSVSQSLYSLSLMAEGWKRLVKAGKEANVEHYANRFAEITQQALKEMRLIIYEMRPSCLSQDGLLEALRQRLGAVEEHAGIKTELVMEELVSFPAPVEEALYWIVQESLNNTLKHAQANQVSIHFYLRDSFVLLNITDNGTGFDFSESTRNSGLGLKTMQERAAEINSVLKIHSTPAEGTTISIQIPLAESVSSKT